LNRGQTTERVRFRARIDCRNKTKFTSASSRIGGCQTDLASRTGQVGNIEPNVQSRSARLGRPPATGSFGRVRGAPSRTVFLPIGLLHATPISQEPKTSLSRSDFSRQNLPPVHVPVLLYRYRELVVEHANARRAKAHALQCLAVRGSRCAPPSVGITCINNARERRSWQ